MSPSILRAAVAMVLYLCVARTPAFATPPTFSDLAYASHWRQRLDLYVPQDRPGPYPVVVYIHGGGWLAGDKTLASRFVDDLMARGLAVAAINYRYSFQAVFPAQLHDCKGAIRWLRGHAGDYNLDASRFAAFGESAGGHLASLVATVTGDAALEGAVGGNAAQSSAVQAVVHGYGPTNLFQLAEFSPQRGSEISALIGHDIYDIIAHQQNPAFAGWVALVHSANPAQHAAGDDPPAYIVHGEADNIVPASQSQLLAAALDSAGAVETFRLLPGVGHVLPDEELPDIYAFLAEQLSALGDSVSFGGSEANEAFGSSIASLGDVNGDGVTDLVVGAPFNDDKGVDAGRVTVHSGANGAVLRIIRGQAAGERFGFALTACGDVNGDSVSDFAVGAPFARTRGARSGRVDLYAGGTWQRLRTFDGDNAGDQLGTSLAAADVDGDGRRDIVCGAPFADQSGTNAGSVMVFDGSDGGLLRRIKGAAIGDRFGWAVASAGDVDGDLREDVIIGAPLSDVGGNNGGSITVVGFYGAKWVTRLRRHGHAGDHLGSAVAGVGDLDGDGRADVAGGAPAAAAGVGVASGVVRLFSPAHATLLATLEPASPQAGEEFGATVAGLGDVDGDSLPDVAVASSSHDLLGNDAGRVTVVGGTGEVLLVLDGPSQGASLGSALTLVDMAGNGGQAVISIGASDAFWGGVRRGVVYIHSIAGSP